MYRYLRVCWLSMDPRWVWGDVIEGRGRFPQWSKSSRGRKVTRREFSRDPMLAVLACVAWLEISDYLFCVHWCKCHVWLICVFELNFSLKWCRFASLLHSWLDVLQCIRLLYETRICQNGVDVISHPTHKQIYTWKTALKAAWFN